jgi:hypothetical protein
VVRACVPCVACSCGDFGLEVELHASALADVIA